MDFLSSIAWPWSRSSSTRASTNSTGDVISVSPRASGVGFSSMDLLLN